MSLSNGYFFKLTMSYEIILVTVLRINKEEEVKQIIPRLFSKIDALNNIKHTE